MWPMIADPDLRCTECKHTIQPGRLCLSELPEETPPGIPRNRFSNYCIGCPQCWAQGKHACYVRHLESQNRSAKTPRALPCVRCGQRIGAQEDAPIELFYEWPEETELTQQTNSTRTKTASIGTAGAAMSIDTLIRGAPDGSFSNVSDQLQRKFISAGLGGDRGFRSATEAQALYQSSVPYSVRNLGEEAVKEFLNGKDASHIQSVYNSPELAADPNNILWELRRINQARRAADMNALDQFQAHATNAFNASTIIFRDCLTTAATSALYATIFEAPVTAVENYIHYRRGRKSAEEAIADVARDIKNRATAAATLGFAINAAVLVLGAGPLLITVAPIIMTVGMALYSYSVLKRITDAMKEDIPLERVAIYYCSRRCLTSFAYDNGKSALIRWEQDRMSAKAA